MGAQPSLRQIGKYVVIDVIGTGGMGIVFSAQDPALGRKVAIKMLKHSEGDTSAGLFGRFFSREMKSTGNLHHKNIVTVYDSGEQDGNPYLVMEYLEGEPVSRLIAERRSMPMEEKLNLMIQVCDGLQYAHDRSVIHRDVKPANVILLPDGTAKIVDFGVSRIAGSETSLVQTGQLVGSLSYMSPEQINSIPIDARSDIFSTGVMLYELLTFELPFKGTDPASTFVKILREEPYPLSRFLRDIPDGMQSVLSRALAKNVNDRYQSAEELGFDLMAVQKEIKSTIISDCMKRAEAAMHRGDLDRVRDSLLEVIRLDRQNERANRLLREVRKAIQQQQRSAQVIQMRSQAQVALAGAQYEEALACADQALRLDPSDQESVMLCQEISNAISRAKAVRDALVRAESALFAGDFDEAKEAIEESLRLDPADSEARALASVVDKELEERSRRQQVQQFVTQARRGIAERKFTDALDALRRAEELDPSDSNVRELLQWANRGQEQERRRRFLVEITDEIEKALHAGDFNSACTISEMGLLRFPEESTLVRLRAISEKQRDIADRRKFVQDQSLVFKTLHDKGKITEAMQVLAEGLRKYPGEPNLESLLAATKAEIEEQKIERERSERLKEMQRAEAEARAQLTQQVLNWSIEIRRFLDARADLGEILTSSAKLRTAIEGRQIDEHAKEVADFVLTEVEARLRSRDQAMIELEHLRVTSEHAQDADSLSEVENRVLSIKATFPNEGSVQQACGSVAGAVAGVRERRDRILASLTELAHAIATTRTGELSALGQRAREIAAAFAGDARVGALMQQIESSAARRLARHEELLRDMDGLRADLARAHSIAENNRISERVKSIVASDQIDDELAERGKLVQAEAARLRADLESLLNEMANLTRAIENAATVHKAEALVPAVKSLAERQVSFQDLQEAATRALAEVQGRRMEHNLIVQELESARSAVSLLDTPEDLESAAARAIQCRDQHSHDTTILSICQEIEAEVGRLLREKAELRERTLECDRALQMAAGQVESNRLDEALSTLEAVEGKNRERIDLAQQLAAVRRAIELAAAERRRVAIQEAMQAAETMLAQGLGAEALARLSAESSEYPDSEELRTATKATEAEVARLRAEEERQEAERRERERLEQERIAREAAAARRAAIQNSIQTARQMLEQGLGQQAIESLHAGLERYSDSDELSAALKLTKAEVDRQQAEQQRLEGQRRERERLERERLEAERLERERLEWERLEQERVAREAAEARRAAIEAATDSAREMLEQGLDLEALAGLRTGLMQFPDSAELKAALEAATAEAIRLQAEREKREAERLERERLEQLRLEAERRERDEIEKQRLEQERAAREAAEARRAAIQGAIDAAKALLDQGRGQQAIESLGTALEHFQESDELRGALEAATAEMARLKAERERLEAERVQKELEEQERLEAERREWVRLEEERIARAEAEDRRAAIEEIIRSARTLLAQGRSEHSLQLLRSALEQYAGSDELRLELESIEEEVRRQRAVQEALDIERQERERLERERLERERLERERVAREAEEARRITIHNFLQAAGELLAQGRGDECLQSLQVALTQYPDSPELQSALESSQAEVTRVRKEQQRQAEDRIEKERLEALERERLEQGRLEQRRLEQQWLERERQEEIRREQARAAKEQAEQRRTAVQSKIRTARELLAQGRGEQSLQHLNAAVSEFPDNRELRSALESMQAEVTKLHVQQKRQEHERSDQKLIAKQHEETRRAAIARSVQTAREMLAKGRGEEAHQFLNARMLEHPDSQELRATLEFVKAETVKLKAEQLRLEKQSLKLEQQRLEQERVAAEKAASAARAGAAPLSTERPATERSARLVSSTVLPVGKTTESVGDQDSSDQGSLSDDLAGKHARNRSRNLLIAAAAIAVLSVAGYFASKLAPKPPHTSSVVFTTEPAGSSLAVDGKSINCPGLCTVPLSPGSHLATLGKEGYSTTQVPITVADSTDKNRPVGLKLELIPAKLSATSTIGLISNLGPALVFLDGRQLGDLSSGKLESEHLRPGQHRVQVVKNGRKLTLSVQVSQQGTVVVDSAEGLEQSAVLVLTHDGSLETMFCRCGGGKIEIDGKLVKPTRGNLYRLPLQNRSGHNVRLLRADLNQTIALTGFDARHAMIRIEGADTVSPAAQPTPAAQKPVGDSSAASGSSTALPERHAAAPGPANSTKPAATVPAPLPAPATISQSPDVAAWNNIREANDVEALTRFRAQFPGSPLAKTALQRVELLSWDRIRNSDQPSDLQNFLREYPDGAHASEARDRLASLATKSQQQDRILIGQALETYRSAYQRKDLNGLAAIWSTLPRSQFQTAFEHAEKILVTLSPSNPTISGDKADVTARQHVEIMVNGKTAKDDTTILFTLRKSQGKWLIESRK